jgi:hypothetical protein
MDGVKDVKRDLAYRRNARLMKRMKYLADMRAKSTSKKQWVIETQWGELKLYNRDELIALRNAGLFDKKVTMQDFDREAVYVAQIENRKRIKQEIKEYDKNYNPFN